MAGKRDGYRQSQRCGSCLYPCKRKKSDTGWCAKYVSRAQAQRELRQQQAAEREQRLKETGLEPLERSMVARELCGNPGHCRAKDPETCRACGWYVPVHEKRVAALRRRFGLPTEKGIK